MLVQSTTIRIVKNLKLPFTYSLLTRARRLYYKDYEVGTPITITKKQSEPISFVHNCTILLEYQKKLFFCPQVDEMYKILGDGGRRSLGRNLSLTLLTTYPTLTIKGRKMNFVTNDVKLIKIKDD